MKRKNEDRLIELAFGELVGHDEEQLRGALLNDPESASTLELYSEMREGLASLRDVPSMQMSCDRLRDAILAGGLKEPRVPAWTWLGVPVAVAAAAFLVTLAIRKPNQVVPLMTSAAGPSVASVEKSVVASPPVKLERDAVAGLESIRADAASTPLGNVALQFEEPVVKAKPPAQRRRPAVKRVAAAPPVITSKAPESGLVASRDANFDHPKAAAMSETSPPKVEETSPAASTVIFISPEPKRGTGTQRATEVESMSNVVIGG